MSEMKASLSFAWTVSGCGWADCAVADRDGELEFVVSHLTDAPTELIVGVTRVVLGPATDVRVVFEAEPNGYRWEFDRDGSEVDMRIVAFADTAARNRPGDVLWESRQPVETLARCVLLGFDRVVADLGEDGWLGQWRRPFPRRELEALRLAWRGTGDVGVPEIEATGLRRCSTD